LRFLDLFAGSGAVAIEALSRGAREAVLIDQGAQAATLIPKNLQACRVADHARFLHRNVLTALNQLTGPFDVVFLDPPYGQGLQCQVLERVSELQLLSPDGLLCAESARNEALPERAGLLLREETRYYGTTALHFYAVPPTEAEVP
jgi:16S rRNA (guanine(966)-N(2))-methyltransferase RsmD